MTTSQPAVQLYTGNYVDGDKAPCGKGGVRYPRYAGFCLETQHYPCSPNFPSSPPRCCGRERPAGSAPSIAFPWSGIEPAPPGGRPDTASSPFCRGACLTIPVKILSCAEVRGSCPCLRVSWAAEIFLQKNLREMLDNHAALLVQ